MAASGGLAIRTHFEVLIMVRTLLGVVLAGTALLAWCWYYSDHLPQHVQQLSAMTQSEEAEPATTAEEASQPEGDEPQVTLVQGPLAFNLFAQDAETGSRDFRKIGLGLASFLGVALVATLLLMMAGLRSYVARVGFVFLLGLFAAVLVQMSDYLFWGQGLDVTAYKSGFFVSGALVAGIILAMFIRPQPTPVRVPVKVR
jgi:hypothetical protein